MNDEVQEYINKQKSPQKEILKKIRKIFLKTIPHCDEKRTWGVVTFAEDKFYIAALQEKVHVGFAVKGLSKEEVSRFEGNGKTMRHIKIKTLKDINERKLINLIKLVNKKSACKSC